MLIALMGDSCTGKSTVAKLTAEKNGAVIFSGKDYLRMAKSESAAASIFKAKLSQAVTKENVIYIITEKEQLAFLPEGGIRVFVTAGLDTVKKRFAARMNGNLPAPVAAMLEKKYNKFETEVFDLKINTDEVSAEEAAETICKFTK